MLTFPQCRAASNSFVWVQAFLSRGNAEKLYAIGKTRKEAKLNQTHLYAVMLNALIEITVFYLVVQLVSASRSTDTKNVFQLRLALCGFDVYVWICASGFCFYLGFSFSLSQFYPVVLAHEVLIYHAQLPPTPAPLFRGEYTLFVFRFHLFASLESLS